MSAPVAPSSTALSGSFSRSMRDALPDRLLLLPIAFGAGIAVYFGLPEEPPAVATAVLAALAAGLMGFALVRRWRGGRPLISLLLSTALAGFLLAEWRTASVAAPVLSRATTSAIEATVIFAEPREQGVRLLLQPSRLGTLAPEALPARIRLNAAWLPQAPAVGSRISGRARLLPPPAPALPGHYDFAFRAWFERIGAVGVLFRGAAVEPPAGAAPTEALARLRNRTTDLLRTALPGTAGGLAAALATGERGGVPEDVQAAMRDAGLAHLLAISGLHLGIVAGTLFFAIRLLLVLIPGLAVRQPVKAWAAALALVGALAYLGLSGASVPTQRAFVMAAFVLVAVIVGRRAITLRSVAWAALVVLALSPESLRAPGFQMSFAAVTALVACYETVDRRRSEGKQRSRFVTYVGGLLLTSLVATLATAPFAIAHFNRVALAAVLANLVAVPLTALWILPLLLLALVAAPFGLAGPPLWLLEPALDLLVALARSVSEWPGTVIAVPAMPEWGLTACVAGGLILCLGRTTVRLAGLLPLLLGLASPYLAAQPDVLAADGLVGLRSPEGALYFNDASSDEFTMEQATARAGQTAAMTFAEAGPWLDCQPWGCRAVIADRVVELVLTYPALAISCRNAARVVVTPLPTHGCGVTGNAKLLIDKGLLARQGGVTVVLRNGQLEMHTVTAHRGRRPWTGS